MFSCYHSVSVVCIQLLAVAILSVQLFPPHVVIVYLLQLGFLIVQLLPHCVVSIQVFVTSRFCNYPAVNVQLILLGVVNVQVIPLGDVNVQFLMKNVKKNGYDLINAYNNVRDILYNTDVITNIVKLIAHSLVGKLA